MWIRVRTMDGKTTLRLDHLSRKDTCIEDIRRTLSEDSYFNVPTENQILFFRGKVLVDGHSLYHYSIDRNDLIQIMIKSPQAKSETNNNDQVKDEGSDHLTTHDGSSDKENVQPELDEGVDEAASQRSGLNVQASTSQSEAASQSEEPLASTYKVGDIIDARDMDSGAWLEAELVKITRKACEEEEGKGIADVEDANSSGYNSQISSPPTEDTKYYITPEMYSKDDGCVYHVTFEGFENDTVEVSVKDIRPRARKVIKPDQLKVGQNVLCCYNMDEPRERGSWFDGVITHLRITRTIKDITATVYVGTDLIGVEDCRLMYWWDMMALEQPGSQLNKITDPSAEAPSKRPVQPECSHCKDKPGRKCKECACRVCGGKDEPGKQILCDECEGAYHLWCLKPPLESLPEDEDWYCPQCKTDTSAIVKSGEGLKASKKKSKMASAKSESTRDWGKGMACVGRSKVCTLVPSNHFGPIPGVEVGTLWKFRVQVSEAGVHRPHVAGIHGREDEGSYSIVLSGGYEDDHDNGNEFYYTGSGGRDLSGNKRTAEQSSDQQLTRMNRALAKNCAATIDGKKGAEAKNWKDGKPVRVVRNAKLGKHSKYAPEEGNRYDGIYKIVKYWPEKGQSGFIVWRYLLRRDDVTPAPWTKEGQKRVSSLGLVMQYPEGYLEAQEEKGDEDKKSAKKGRKRKRSEGSNGSDETDAPAKKATKYDLSALEKKVIRADDKNKVIWDDVKLEAKGGRQALLKKIEDCFSCVCCVDLVCLPVSTECRHNVCKACLQRSFKAEVYSCPMCRYDLGKGFKMTVNEPLRAALQTFYPGYETGR